jgi:sigma-B regulation protein RsbQ
MLLPAAPTAHPALQRHNVRVLGRGSSTLLFCNGYNCSQLVWNYLVPALAAHHRLVLFDQMGTGQSDITAYEPQKYETLAGYAQDVVEICQALDLREVTIVGHSEGGTVAMLAVIQAPEHFAKAVLLAASPCHLNRPGYHGGFEEHDMQEMLASINQDYRHWATTFALMLMGQDQHASLGYELANHFCLANPTIARQATRVTFLSDYRASLPQLQVPTLLLQCADDMAVPPEVNDYLLTHLPHATLTLLPTTGHCPHMSVPLLVLAALHDFLA